MRYDEANIRRVVKNYGTIIRQSTLRSIGINLFSIGLIKTDDGRHCISLGDPGSFTVNGSCIIVKMLYGLINIGFCRKLFLGNELYAAGEDVSAEFAKVGVNS